MPKEYNVWRDTVRLLIRQQVPTAVLGMLPLTCDLLLDVTFTTPTGQMRPDLDNAVGAIMDAIQVPPCPKGRAGMVRGGWGLIENDKQIKAILTRLEVGPSSIQIWLDAITREEP